MASSLVNNKYRITRRIGGGSFGEIYMGVGPNNEKVAVKFERHGTRCPQLRHEYKVYRELTGCHGFCQVYHFGTQDNYNVMVMDLLGPSLEDLFNKCNRRFSLKTVLQIADQMLERADTLHSRHLIHRDIKPANFVIGLNENAANIFCVDFGLSKRYRHPKNLHHIPHRDGRSLTGTPRYASINNHLGIEQSRRDDLESIGYVLIYFLKGSLPWQGLKAKNAQKKYRLILEKKQQVSIAQLCQGCPSQFAEFLAYTRSLKFDAKPDIPYLRKLFRDLYHAQGCGSIPKLWDWDSVDADYMSATGSAGGGGNGGAPAITTGQFNSNQRPTTAAAVANPNVALESDLLLGTHDVAEDYEEVPDANNRPNTAGAMMTGNGYNRTSGQGQQNTWGYSRNGDPTMGKTGSGPLEYGATDNTGGNSGQPRRPHTAHGARAGTGQPMYTDAPGEDGDAHVVAGARGMMRYRRNRATTIESNGGQPVTSTGYGRTGTGGDINSGSGGGGGGSWAVVNNNNSTMKKTNTVGGTGWNNAPTYDRPKSASNTGSNAGSNNRPVSSSMGQSNWNSQGGNPQVATGNNSNTLSYGSLKNRFLSGNNASGNNKANYSGTGNNPSSNSQQNSASGKSGGKLFSLAR